MSKDKLIADVRVYERGHSIPADPVLEETLGRGLLTWPCRLGRRFGLLLRSLGQTLPGFDHIYMTPTTRLGPGSVELELFNQPEGFSFYRCVQVGVDRREVQASYSPAAHDAAVAWLARGAAGVLAHFDRPAGLVERAAAEMLRFRDRLEIPLAEHRARGGTVGVLLRLRVAAGPNVAVVEWRPDGGPVVRTELALSGEAQLFAMLSRMTVKDGCVVLRRRSSFRAELWADGLPNPLVLPIAEMTAASEAEPKAAPHAQRSP